MSIDELTRETAPAAPERRVPWVPIVIASVAAVAVLIATVWVVASRTASSTARASHDAVVESVNTMSVLWEQLALPVDERSQQVIEGAASLGGTGGPVNVSTQLRVNAPNRIGVVVTVTSDGITTLVLQMVRTDAGGNQSAIGTGCEVGVDYDGQTCEQIIESELATFTAPGG
jgi:hypothetical protein